ncbi:anthranilate synthase component I [Komagataeibacter intermedius]|uniref:Anthranilate synthase component 1 n=2 Tax=Komagataeibacter intermedius TaxID=66229 RepID=A0A0N1FA36_9PROT|nr:anthranilate synthase component I [Komagataeibacter intermedius]KPH87772.1 anthranilate synthase subunit I [Komagataeibacter intermedius AF2]MCF3635986.1 anthranilate synthase component I [Komagataeibacter intermedius]GAN88552.1 anthranilate/para-aminobenzoate synthase component I [Komagataeibacter intermedius TF2]GBQ70761.1 anthranilate synthase component I [Komagataeibacter intermedius NRIC 0521]
MTADAPRIRPSFRQADAARREAALADLRAGRGTVAWRVEPADLLTPVAAFLRLSRLARSHGGGNGGHNAFLLESVEGGTSRGRYSVIGLLPDLIWRCHDGRASVCHDPAAATHEFVPETDAPLVSLRRILHESRMDLPEGLPPMTGGVFGYLGYDMIRQVEHLPDMPADDLDLPEGIMIRPGLFAIFDTVRDELLLAAPLRPAPGQAPEAIWDAAQDRLQQARAALSTPVELPDGPVGDMPAPVPQSTMTREEFCGVVRRLQDYIAAGDAFQIVPSQRFSAPFSLPPFALYRALRRINPAPFLFYLDLDGFSLVGSSPEILVRLREGTMTVRPLAGTRPRGRTTAEDMALEAELLADPKERAEHLMLIDLGRNDVGRVCELGSVRVTEQFVIERFSHVMHISSNVEGTLRPDLEALDALMSGFPAGTLTGAPKIRAMQIIDEVEPTRRATYAGCIGYFGPDGDMDTCIGLRMAVVRDGRMYVQAGCGVVADSVPDAEYEETRQKARALFRAAEEAVRFASGDDA